VQQSAARNTIVAVFASTGRWLAISTGAVTAILLFGMFAIVILGVVFRYVIQAPLQWTEEMARFLMLWSGFIGMNVAMYHRQHLAIDSLLVILPGWLTRILGYICDVLILYFLIILINRGYAMTTRTMMQASSMEFSMYWIYMAVPLGALLTLIQHVLQILCKLIQPPAAQAAASA